MVNQLPSSTRKDIIYPETDGQPMAENTKQFELIVLIKKNLDLLFANEPEVFVAGDLFWYPVEDDNATRRAPDVAETQLEALRALLRDKGINPDEL